MKPQGSPERVRGWGVKAAGDWRGLGQRNGMLKCCRTGGSGCNGGVRTSHRAQRAEVVWGPGHLAPIAPSGLLRGGDTSYTLSGVLRLSLGHGQGSYQLKGFNS